METLFWRKWHRVDANLLVALETTLPAGKAPDYVLTSPADLPEKMVHLSKELAGPIARVLKAAGVSVSRETVDRYYHPRVGGPADLTAEKGSVSFKVHVHSGLFKRIVLRRKGEDGPAPAMRCGRAKELDPKNQDKVFGFNSSRSNSDFYLHLSYPGEDGKFEPVFVKVADYREGVYYLKVSASGGVGGVECEDDVVVVEVEVVSSSAVPAFLRGHN